MDESMDWNKKEWVELKKNDARFEVGLVRSLLVQLKVWSILQDKVLEAQKIDVEVGKVRDKVK